MDRSRPARRRVEALYRTRLSVSARETFQSAAARPAGYAGDMADRRSVQPSQWSTLIRRSSLSNDNGADQLTSAK